MSSVVFLDLLSQPCRAVFMFVKKNKLPVEVQPLTLMKGEHYTEEFGKINPLRKVPALKDGDFCMGESVAMMEYMAEKFDTPDHWFPKDLQKRARVNEYLHWQHLAIRMHGAKMLYLKLLIPMVYKMEVPEDKMAAAMEDLNESLDHIENVFIKDEGFIGGEQICIADLTAIGEIMQPYGSGVDVFRNRPKLREWKERVERAVGEELFREANAAIMAAKDFLKDLDPKVMEAFRPQILKLIN